MKKFSYLLLLVIFFNSFFSINAMKESGGEKPSHEQIIQKLNQAKENYYKARENYKKTGELKGVMQKKINRRPMKN